MHPRTKKFFRIAAIPFSLALIGGYVAFRASGCSVAGKDGVVAPPGGAAIPVEPDPMMFSGSKSGAMFTPAPSKVDQTEMFVGSKSGGISRPEDFAPIIDPADAFKLPAVPAKKPSEPAKKPGAQPAQAQPK